MRFTDETLMAFADGELDASTRHEVELAMRVDPVLAAKVQQHILLRRDVFRAFARTLDEPVPQRLRQAATSSPKVVHLDSVRAARKPVVLETPRRWSWPEWGAIAATLVVGVLSGTLGLHGVQGETTFASAGSNGALSARGKLDTALTRQLASAPPASAGVTIGVSFVAKDGQYCRTFAMGDAAGLACRSGGQWNIPVLVDGAGGSAGAAGAYRQAGSAMPPAVLDAMDARAVGPSLDAKAEQAAAQRGWSR
jgi:hypothetical protein